MPKKPLWYDAAAFSAWAHRHDVRKDGHTPYAAHPFRVAMTVRTVFGVDDEVAIAAAMLHDVIEDTPCDYDDVSSRFGDEVAGIVAALTKNMLLPEAERERDYDERLALADWRAVLIKLADAYDNLLDLQPMTGESRSSYEARSGRARVRVDRALALAEGDTRLARAAEVVRAGAPD
ncbi:MAG: HD domain-containing protein [Planctomycetota bacterium]